ncbi:glycogenin-1 isoform X2 [Falco peregrinus]|uniref:glycogenin-1 isoform X2 n=1 Tax=Falco peregrinus TaxID=8954 RepID=UPI00247A53FF|nr:glycogenin-1 isoform X2 [Falco peregrinus]
MHSPCTSLRAPPATLQSPCCDHPKPPLMPPVPTAYVEARQRSPPHGLLPAPHSLRKGTILRCHFEAAARVGRRQRPRRAAAWGPGRPSCAYSAWRGPTLASCGARRVRRRRARAPLGRGGVGGHSAPQDADSDPVAAPRPDGRHRRAPCAGPPRAEGGITCHRRGRPWRRPRPAATRGFLRAGPPPPAKDASRVAPPLYKRRPWRSPASAAAASAPAVPGSGTMADQSFVTLATNDSYVKGALVLGSSLQQYRTTRKLTALITPQVSDLMRRVLEKVFDEVILVNVLDSGDSAHLALMKRPELGVTLTKLHCWELTQFSKCVFMDADTMVLSNIDELFEREELSAAPDPGWPDCFNSGVFVYRPSIETYNQLLQFATEKGSFDATLVLAYQTTSRSFDLIATSTFKLRCDLSQHGADQGLLNTFFSSWATTDISKHLPFIYNLSSTSVYSYLPAFKAFGANTKVVHFLGSTKPWNYTYDSRTKSIKGNMDAPKIVHPEFLNMWWDTYIADVLPLLEQHGIVNDITTGVNMAEVTEAVSHISVSAPVLPTVSSEERKERWEQGQADYMGVDSFDNIKKKLDTYLQ